MSIIISSKTNGTLTPKQLSICFSKFNEFYVLIVFWLEHTEVTNFQVQHQGISTCSADILNTPPGVSSC